MATGLRAGAAYIDVYGRLAKNFDRDVEKEAGGRMKSVGGKLGGLLAAGVAGAGALAGAALVKGFSDAIENEAAGDKVAASFGLDPDVQARLGAVAGDLYADAYGESLGQVTEAAANVQRSLGELTDAEVEDLTANALDFASAFDTDVNDAVANAGFLLKNGLVKDGEEAFDILTTAMQRTAPAVRDEILAATQEYSTFFGDLGLSGSEAFGLMTRAAEKGGNFGVDKVGDALKELTIRATDMSSASVDAYEAAGLSAEDMASRFLAGGDEARGALSELVGGLQDIEDPVERANAAIGLFGTPLEDMSVTEIPEFLGQLQNVERGLGDTEGAADRMGDTLNDNLKTKIEGLKRGALQRLSDFMGNTVIPAVEKFGPVVEQGIGQAVAFIQEKWPQIEATIRPIIEQIVALVEEKWPQIRDTIVSVLETLEVVFAGWVELISTLWNNFGTYILDFISTTWDAIFRVIGGALEMIRGIVELVLGIITGDWSRAWEGLKMILSGAWDVIAGIFEMALARVELVIRIGLDILKAVFSGAWDAIKSTLSGALDGIVDFFSKLPGRMARAAGDVFGFLWEAFKDAVNLIIRGWNRLEFKIPGFDPPGPGPKFGGFTLGVPDIPLLATGARRVLGQGWAVVGDEGPELMHVGAGARVLPNDVTVAALAGAGRGGGVTIERLEVPTAVDATADEVVDAIGAKLGWKLTTRNDR